MTTRSERIRLGLFLLLGLILAAGFVLVIGGRSLLRQVDGYFIEYENTSLAGLEPGNAVKHQGIDVGQVRAISVDPADPNKLVVAVDIKKGTAFRADANAQVEVFGITGLKYINVVGGSAGAPLLKPGEKILPGLSAIQRVTGRADVIMEKLEVVLNHLMGMTDDQMRLKLGAAVQALGQTAGHINELLSQNKGQLNQMAASLPAETGRLFQRSQNVLARMDSAAQDLQALLKNKSLGQSLKNMEAFSGDLKSSLENKRLENLLESLQHSTKNFNQAMGDIGKTVKTSQERLDNILAKLERTASNLADFTQTIKENPSLLIRKSSEEE